MFIEEQDDDVEEEEEFHEVEEEKHRTSQESVPDSCDAPNTPTSTQQTKSTQGKSSLSEVVLRADTTTSAPEEIGHNSTTIHDSTTIHEPNTSQHATTLPDSASSDKQTIVDDKATVELSKTDDQSTAVKISQTLENSTTVENSTASDNPTIVEKSKTSDISTTPDTSPTLDTSTTLLEPTTLDNKKSEENSSATVVDAGELSEDSVANDHNNQCATDSSHDNIPTNETKSDVNNEPKAVPDASDWANIMLLNENSTAPSDKTSENNDPSIKQNSEEDEKKELDLDEDVKNPQYIPKKGVFYEHDDRSHDDNSKKISGTPTKKDVEVHEAKEISGSKKGGGLTEKQVENKKGNRRHRTDADRWNHDLFRDTRQKPKSKSELITAYGYDIRSERMPRINSQPEGRQPRAGNSGSNIDRSSNHDNQKSRQIKDNRVAGRQNHASNRSRERRSRRGPNLRNNSRTQNSTLHNSSSAPRNEQPNRSFNVEANHDTVDSKQTLPAPQPSVQLPSRTDNSTNQRGSRFDGQTRRQSPRDRVISNSIDDNLPPLTTVMPPITTWSNKIEDMVKEEANRRESPSRHLSTSSTNSRNRTMTNDCWPQNHQQNKSTYIDRGPKNFDENRQQSMHSNRSRYGGREESHKVLQFATRNQFNDRANQQNQEWRRTTNYNNAYAKSTEYEPIKTQTFENSKLSQVSINRSHYRDQRDAREIINERRMLNHQQQEQTYQSEIHPITSGREFHSQHQQQIPQRNQPQQQHPKHLSNQPEPVHQLQPAHQHHHQQQQPLQQNSNHSRHQLRNHVTQLIPHNPQIQVPRDQQHPRTQSIAHQQQQHPPASLHQSQAQLHHLNTTRQNPNNNSVVDNLHESSRLNVGTGVGGTNDIINNNSRPIIKTDSYTNAPQQTTLPQHSHNHLTGPISQTSGTATTHIVPSHLGTGSTQAPYYSPTANSRDSAAALASAYHGYMAGGHSVLDASRYHMTSQLSDHGYIAPSDPAADVPSAARIMHQQGIYSDAAAAGNSVPGSAYMTQTAPNLSPSTNIPVTGAGPPPLTPVSYLQHSQYHPPYTNPYTHPQHNHQAPPQSSHAYPYWTYI